LLSWRVAILPLLVVGNRGESNAEFKKLYEEFKLDEPWDSKHNKQLLKKIPDIYKPIAGKVKDQYSTFYQVPTGEGTAFESKEGARLPGSFPDGTSNTMLITEAAEAVPWTKPEDLVYKPGKLPKFGGMFKNGFNVAT